MKKEHNIFALAMLFCLAIVPVYGQYYSKTVMRATQRAKKMTRLHFFLHDTVSGENPSAVVIARPNITQPSSFGFGTLFAINDPLTVGPALTSTLIGNAQGLYVSSSRDPAVFTTVMYADFAFTSGRFNGSSFSLISRSSSSDAIRELAIVGGRGAFRMAQGFALTQINFANLTTGDVILECNVTLYHY
ncbi:hypothetical protein E1A91_A01G179500v1 [Gossypium mustelinum]|uniref:Dirigent protein n=4 Tax=Gossypium TaxID=3633 RepID=A0A5J5X0F9_GOSBA|nr:hypothetical protein ES319_A01G175200v1 [Gossypium barbadense]TYH31670.1 hypothetical protein ES288_A01G190800v1 [Gossypium darwinii]TYI43852.1 hypothetical protein ES332_A01G196700v1 [Gossypium tomentosum]TYJ50055.1 hypothetical protein E1A91_A01G179500v1 [Gossypium mustelinum]KAB2097512.1 hypothetical protein ES319_A01G175400v1 [Gossypium barbadense]